MHIWSKGIIEIDMSIAGKKSSLGDEYQLRVALHWLIKLLEDDAIESIQVNSTGLLGENSSVTVDDIVVLYKNGRACFIQAKKNQTDHKAWSFSDKVLKDELCKARDQLESRANSEVKFYSRSPFGDLASLKENCKLIHEYSAFHREADSNQQKSLATLAKILERSEQDTYSLVNKISFDTPKDFDEWDRQNKLDLERLIPMADLAIDVLERYLVSHETNLRDTKPTITRSDVLAKLTEKGISPTPKRTEAEILAAFKQASTIGRNWLRTIDGEPIPRSEPTKIIELIDRGSRTILLTDRPGSGKTCVLLDLVDYIEREKESVWGLLFIKGDLFTNVESERDLVGQGFPEDLVGQCARLSDFRRVVVVIDSLDVLSLSRQHEALKVFLRIIDRLEKIDKVTIVTACRNFDLEYDPLLRGRSWQHKIYLQPLDFENEVKPFLIRWQVDIFNLTPELRALLQIPQNLRIYEKLAKLGVRSQPASAYELYDSFINEVVVKNPRLGNNAIVALQNMAERLMQNRIKSCIKASFGVSEDIVRELISQEVLLENSPEVLEFSHQTLGECITVQAALAKNQTLAQFILDCPQLPFIRPAVRAFFFYLRAYQPDSFRRQVWEVLSHDEIAYHVRRLVCESFAEISPVDEDWRSLRRIFQQFPDLFQRLLLRVNNRAWFNIVTRNLFPEVLSSEQREKWLLQIVGHLSVWMNIYPVEVVALWREAIAQPWANTQSVAQTINSALINFQAWKTNGIREILEAIIDNLNAEYSFVGDSLSKWIQATNSGDDLLWRYITKNISSEDACSLDLRDRLRCMPHDFHDDNFLEIRFCQSDTLLNLALNELERYSAASPAIYGADRLRGAFLRYTSWQSRHSRSILDYDDIHALLNAVEKAIKYRARHYKNWWIENEERLRNSQELAIRYFAIEAYQENIDYSGLIRFWTPIAELNCLAGFLFLNEFFQAYIHGVEKLLQDDKILRDSDLSYELGQLMHAAYPKISKSAREANQATILSLLSERKEYEEELSFWAYHHLYDLCLLIPCIFRNENIQEFIERVENDFGYTRPEPNIHSWGGCVVPPLSPQDLLKLSDKGIFQLLRHYRTDKNPHTFDRNMVGGFSEVKRVLSEACSLDPARFVALFTQFIEENDRDYLCAVVEGVATHLRSRFSNLSPRQPWEPIEPLPDGKKLATTLLNWLERYAIIWEEGRTLSAALEACCEVLIDFNSAERLSLLLFWLYSKYSSDRELRADSQDPDFARLNCVHGVGAESAIRLYNRLLEKEQPVPELLLLLLRHIASDKAIYVRLPVLDRLPFLMSKKPELGWQLLADIFQEPQAHLWKYIEWCLYYQYRDNFNLVAPYLNRLLLEGMDEAGETWGRISTLASLAGHIRQEELFKTLEETQNHAAWKGATQVFVANLDLQEHTAKCISGLFTILCSEYLSDDIIFKIDRCFEAEKTKKLMGRRLALAFIEGISPSTTVFKFDGFLKWLGHESSRDPLSGLELTEALAEKFETMTDASLLWQTAPLISALNEILREADETDDPKLIQRAIDLQDRFLRLGIRGIEELLNSAARE